MIVIGKILRKMLINGIDFPPHAYSKIHSEPDRKLACLTYDDGPDIVNTPGLLDILGEMKVKATFFCIGENIENNGKIAERIVKEGHSLQNHSYSHCDFSKISRFAAETEIRKCRNVIETITGIKNEKFFRPPRGSISFENIIVTRRCEEKIVLWSHNIKSYEIQSTLRHKKCIFLGHDDSNNISQETKETIKTMSEAGYEFIALEEFIK